MILLYGNLEKMKNKRPSNKEKHNNLQKCRELILLRKRRIEKPLAFQQQLRDLDLTPDELWDKILEIIPEIDPIGEYAGGSPPQKSYEKNTVGAELWAYSWNSPVFGGQKMYFKFAILSEVVWIVSFHYSNQ